MSVLPHFSCSSLTQIIETQFFLYLEEIPIFYPLLNILKENFRKTLIAIKRTDVYTDVIFFTNLKKSNTIQWLVRSTNDCTIKHHSRWFAFYFRIFQGHIWLFQGKFLDFTINISELFTKFADKF